MAEQIFSVQNLFCRQIYSIKRSVFGGSVLTFEKEYAN